MIQEENGGAKKTPPGAKVLHVYFDPAVDDAGVVFDGKDFKTWDFVLAVLAMATRKAELTRTLMEKQAMQGMLGQAMQEEQIRRKLLRGG